MAESITATVRLLDREFLVGCAPEEREGLMAAATFLDGKMRELRGSSRSVGYDRVAVLAALSIAHELLQLRHKQDEQLRGVGEGLSMLRRKLEGALVTHVK
ncbi:MAG TPA: cell division protein ZapA [Rhodanobacteraceae bacterium]|nr:cell division protein ZapA [Rhodanobacteraceae bacterium]